MEGNQLDVTYTSDDSDNGSPDLVKLFALLQHIRRNQMLTPKRFEMSRLTLSAIERKFDLIPRSSPSSTLWGIEIVFNDKLPLNEIKSIY